MVASALNQLVCGGMWRQDYNISIQTPYFMFHQFWLLIPVYSLFLACLRLEPFAGGVLLREAEPLTVNVSEDSTGQQNYKQLRGRMSPSKSRHCFEESWKERRVVASVSNLNTVAIDFSSSLTVDCETNLETVQLCIVFLIRLLSLVSVAFVSSFVLS